MSYDVQIRYPACPRCKSPGHTVASLNYTYNVHPMLKKAFAREEDINFLAGLKCHAAVVLLNKAIANMESDPTTYEAMNPPNGWGDYESCLVWLREIRGRCRENPDAEIEVW